MKSKFHHAAYVFFGLNILYLILIYIFLPPFNLGIWESIAYSLLFTVFFGLLSYVIFKESLKLTLILFIVYSIRTILSIYTVATGQAFVAVPYVLPCLILTIYFLGRPLWNWP